MRRLLFLSALGTILAGGSVAYAQVHVDKNTPLPPYGGGAAAQPNQAQSNKDNSSPVGPPYGGGASATISQHNGNDTDDSQKKSR